ncbi:hemolysin family protein [Boudabousia marimammalium]|uniref:CBS domain-containing protein n=1 Tax=Boudabousia marimammalium TaxID=156892 RepID=A0A1Q5PP60_9ACTO|nr:hemolysin family protein [Boudabousia marimammalium]OKL49317.1 hypothetical protein BM477_04890 [Boudabousia marimammalium]
MTVLPLLLQAAPVASEQNIPVIILTVVSLLAFLVAGLLNAVETALEHLSKASAEDLVDDEREGAKLVLAQVSDRARTDRSVRSLRLAMQSVATVFLTLVLVQSGWVWWLIALIALLGNWLLLSVAVSVVPRQFSYRWPGGVMLFLRSLTAFAVKLNSLFEPVTRSLRRLRPASTQTEAEARREMADDLREMVDQVGEAELFEDEDRKMLRSVFELGQTLVREVMLPRPDMIVIDATANLRDAMKLFVRSGFSRLPVIGEDSDDIRGLVYFKDVTRNLMAHPETATLPVTKVMRQAHFLPEILYADDVLRLMQRDSFHMAILVDEWGGIAGLVTLEDLLEEVVGELTDEHDREIEEEPAQVAEGVWQVPSRYPIDDLGEIFEIELEDEDVDSVGGLVAKVLNKVPLPGAKVVVKNLEFIAQEAMGRRKQVAYYHVRALPAESE